MRIKNHAILLVFLTISSPAFADSDGSYCIGSDYLAYELWNRKGERELHIVKPNEAEDPVVTTHHPLPKEYGWATLDCQDEYVMVSSFSETLKFDLAAKTFEKQDEIIKLPANETIGAFRHINDKDKITLLEGWGDETYEYQLHVIGYSQPRTADDYSYIEHHTISRIVRMNKKMGPSYEGIYDIFSSSFIETMD